MKAVDSVLKIISVFFEVLTQVLLVVMVGVITWLVISRQVLNNASQWAEEISLVMLIWFGLIGATFGVRDRFHLRMDMLFRPLPKAIRLIIAHATDLIVLAVGVLMVSGGIEHITLTMDQTLPATKLPGAIRYIPLPITGALIAVYTLRNIIAGDTAKDASPQAEQEKIH